MKSNAMRGKGVARVAFLTATLLLLLSGLGCNTTKDTAGVMATVNGRKIQRTEVDKYYSNQTADAPQKPTA